MIAKVRTRGTEWSMGRVMFRCGDLMKTSAHRARLSLDLRLKTPRFKAFSEVKPKPAHVNGLLQKIDNAERPCLSRSFPASIRCDNDAVDVWRSAAEGPKEIHTSHARHSQIGNDNHGARTARLLQGFNTIRGRLRLVSPNLQ